MPSLQSLDIRRRSATTTQPPNVREHMEVAKLIDISRCIGCKACQAACLEWNDLRDEVGHNTGHLDNPPDLTEKSWTIMRFAEVEEDGNLEWLIRKDGCMHCADPGCLKACPAPGAIVQYANGIVDFVEENCIGCGYCIRGCPFDIPRLSPIDHKVYKCTLCSDRVAGQPRRRTFARVAPIHCRPEGDVLDHDDHDLRDVLQRHRALAVHRLEPFADDLASYALDILVAEAGWRRATPNLFLMPIRR